jgi:hypothetical protein
MSDIQVSNRIIGTMTIKEREVRGEGGPHDARIVFPLSVTMHPQPSGAMLALTELRCSLHLSTPGFASNQIGQAVTIPLLEGLSCRSSTSSSLAGHIEVRLPLNEQLIASLEAHRHQHPEGTFVAYLGIHATIAWVVATGNATPAEARMLQGHPLDSSLGLFSLLAPFWYPKVEDVQVQIPASLWVSNVLPPLGFSSLRLIEVFLPAANGLLPDALIASFDAARRDYDLGNYRECVQKCRDVRNAVEQHLGATRQHPVADVIGDRLGLPPSAIQRAFLRNTWAGLTDLTNAAHHQSTVQGLLRTDAHVCLLITALLVEYISQLH